MSSDNGQAKIGLVVLAVVFIVLGVVAFTKKSDDSKEKSNFTGVSKNGSTTSAKQSGLEEVKSDKLANNYFLYSKESYTGAKTYKLPLLLFFYKKDCSSCEEQGKILVEVFNRLEKSNVLGFQINFGLDKNNSDIDDLLEEFDIKEDLEIIILDSDGQKSDTFKRLTDSETLAVALNKVSISN
jgi:hypothetical protein